VVLWVSLVGAVVVLLLLVVVGSASCSVGVGAVVDVIEVAVGGRERGAIWEPVSTVRVRYDHDHDLQGWWATWWVAEERERLVGGLVEVVVDVMGRGLWRVG